MVVKENPDRKKIATSYAGVRQESILRPLLFLIYIHDLNNNLSSSIKFFADNTSLFSVVNDVNLSEFHLNSDLKNI